jgi:hypothetical protein
MFFIQPALLPFFIKRIEGEGQRNAYEKSPHNDTGLFPLCLQPQLYKPAFVQDGLSLAYGWHRTF